MDSTIDEFPTWSLLPKKETGVTSFLTKYDQYNGQGVTIAIFDSGIDPGAPGLQKTPDGQVKVIERFDCSGCGDVSMSTIVQPKESIITGISGKKLKIPSSWKNPSNEYRIGIKNAFDLYPERLRERMKEEQKEKHWDSQHKLAYADAFRKLSNFEAKHNNTQVLSVELKLEKENLEGQLEHLSSCEKKYNDLGTYYDCVMFHDGEKWLACVDTTEDGNLEECNLIGEYSITHEFASLNLTDQLNFSINVHDDGNILELVGLCSIHGTHVASIASAYFPDEPEKNGVAPGAQIISLTIGDGRLGSMETGTALVRAMIKVMELKKKMPVDIINMSYGEHAHWSNAGRIGELMNEIVNKYGVIWVASAGNHGPALSTIGTPPDISQETIIGVGAYVSPDMMAAEYAMRQKLPGMPYTWSSRGPTIDGGVGVTVCAPGGAITSVPTFTLRNSQLMNGTSMASPHVAGAVGLLVSGLKMKNIKYSPYHIKRALENGATFLNKVDVFAQGSGLLNVEKSFELLSRFENVPERDVRFHISCGSNGAKGIYIRNKNKLDCHDFAISIEPYFLDDKNIAASEKINFNLKLALTCKEAYVNHPQYLDLSNMSRAFGVKIYTKGLQEVNYTFIEAYDTNCIEKGVVFKIPITIIIPKEVTAPKYSLSETNVYFEPNTIKRNFIIVPQFATWAVLKLRSCNEGNMGNFVIHCMHLLPKQSCKSLELNKHIPVTSSAESLLTFQVRELTVLEVVIAKYWANIGDINIDYTISFHGIKPNQNAITMLATDGVHQFEVTTLQGEDILPSISLKNSVNVLRPTDAKINPLGPRDIIPPGRQIYEMVATFNFHLNKAAEVSPNYPLLSDVLYESEFESQLWMLFDCNKQYLGCGDAYASKYNIKLEKGDYILKLQIRHEKKEYLEKLVDVPVLLNQKLSSAIVLDVYNSYSQAITNGKKATIGHSLTSLTHPLYITPLNAEKMVTKNNPHYWTGSMTLAKDEHGKRVNSYSVKYVLYETSKKPSKTPEKNKTKLEEYTDAVRDLKVSWLAKLDATNKAENVYNEMLKEFPDFLQTHNAYMQTLDPMDVKRQLPVFDPEEISKLNKDNLKRIIEICDKILDKIDQDTILIHAAIKVDQRADAALTKSLMDRQKNILIECLCRKGISLCKLYASGNQEVLESIADIWKNVCVYVDPNDSKVYIAYVTYFGCWYGAIIKNYGKLLKCLQKINDEKPTEEVDLKLIEVYKLLNWDYLARHLGRQTIAKFPKNFRPF